MPNKVRIPDKLQPWVAARERYSLTHAQVQMARELGLNARKLGAKAGQQKGPTKLPVPQFIEHLYLERFKKEKPDCVLSIEERVQKVASKKNEKRDRCMAQADGRSKKPGATGER